jgi:hypothetical protein
LPIFRGRTVFQIAQDWKAFLNIDAGITRGELPDSGRRITPPSREGSTPPDTNNVRPERIVWTFGSAWSDSGWLGSMMGTTEGTVWNRPLLGDLFGDLFYVRAAHRRDKDFVGLCTGRSRGNPIQAHPCSHPVRSRGKVPSGYPRQLPGGQRTRWFAGCTVAVESLAGESSNPPCSSSWRRNSFRFEGFWGERSTRSWERAR